MLLMHTSGKSAYTCAGLGLGRSLTTHTTIRIVLHFQVSADCALGRRTPNPLHVLRQPSALRFPSSIAIRTGNSIRILRRGRLGRLPRLPSDRIDIGRLLPAVHLPAMRDGAHELLTPYGLCPAKDGVIHPFGGGSGPNEQGRTPHGAHVQSCRDWAQLFGGSGPVRHSKRLSAFLTRYPCVRRSDNPQPVDIRRLVQDATPIRSPRTTVPPYGPPWLQWLSGRTCPIQTGPEAARERTSGTRRAYS